MTSSELSSARPSLDDVGCICRYIVIFASTACSAAAAAAAAIELRAGLVFYTRTDKSK
jgi:hypothetical protein